MLTLAHTSSTTHYGEDASDTKIAKAWKDKEKQIRAKADMVLKDDPDYTALVASWKKKWWKF